MKDEAPEEESTRATTTCEVFQWADSYDITIMVVGAILALVSSSRIECIRLRNHGLMAK